MAAATYEKRRENTRQRLAEESRTGRDIGAPPKVKDKKRREEASKNLKNFCEIYFGDVFAWPWSNDHLTTLSDLDTAIKVGGLKAVAMPRGSGKTSIAECAVIFAVLTGRKKYVVIFGADKESSTEICESIKISFETNEAIGEDFPEVCYPVRCLEGVVNRCAGQLSNGKKTRITWKEEKVTLPTIDGSDCSGAIIVAKSLLSRMRGMKKKTADGKSLRPDFCIVEDPQTDESARSQSQVEKRLKIINGAILGLAGPGVPMPAFALGTVIEENDLMCRLVDRDLHPEWGGLRMKMVYEWPKAMDLWRQYEKIRRESLKKNGDDKEATEFYRKNRKKMDAGSKVAWNERYLPSEISALQHAFNLKMRDPESFSAEYQNDPIEKRNENPDVVSLNSKLVQSRTNGTARGVVPVGTVVITAFIDVQKNCFFYSVVAWRDHFSGCVIDYGTHPKQNKKYYRSDKLQKTLKDLYPVGGFESRLAKGLSDTIDMIAGDKWRGDDGVSRDVDLIMIDANWGQSTEVIYTTCGTSPYKSILLPSHGKYIGASSRPITESRRTPGDIIGLNWKMPRVARGRSLRHILVDVNYWKSLIAERLQTEPGDTGALVFYGKKNENHHLIADHCASEYSIRTEGRGRMVDEWKLRAGEENHLFDCLVGCAVGASVKNVKLKDIANQTATKRDAVKLSDLQKKKREAAGNGSILGDKFWGNRR